MSNYSMCGLRNQAHGCPRHVSLLQPGITGTVSVGIEIIPAFQRQGYGSVADEIILAYATKSGYKTANAQVSMDNEGSAGYLLEKEL